MTTLITVAKETINPSAWLQNLIASGNQTQLSLHAEHHRNI